MSNPIHPLILLALVVSMLPTDAACQSPKTLESGRKTSLRGLSVVDDSVAWVSGSNGTIGRTTDGGRSWRWTVPRGFEKTDFRDIEAFDAENAVIMGIAEPAYILRTTNGGKDWAITYSDSSKGVFLDAMHFRGDGKGVVVGDPLGGHAYLASTEDAGRTWNRIAVGEIELSPGEAFFAASGSNIILEADGQILMVTGGAQSRLLTERKAVPMPLLQGGESSGANALAKGMNAEARERIVVVGGDFSRDSISLRNCLLTDDRGMHWILPETPPHGYRSCVEWLGGSDWLACGTNGVDVSTDGGMNWKNISPEGFHVAKKAKNGHLILLAGQGGRIAVLSPQ